MKKAITLIALPLLMFAQTVWADEIIEVREKSVPITVQEDVIDYDSGVTVADEGPYYFMHQETPYVCVTKERKGWKGYHLKAKKTKVFCTTNKDHYKIVE